MNIFKSKNKAARKLPILFLAVASVSACSTVITRPTAGGPSSHTPQRYETTTSTAAVTSTLGGSALLAEIDPVSGALLNLTTVATTGSTTHSTGRIELDDGIYLFIDTDGPDVNGNVVNANSSAGGTVGPAFTTDFSGYDYVLPYRLGYLAAPNDFVSVGVSGMITGSADMPSAGRASYTGVALAALSHYTAADYPNDIYLDDGVSTVEVDFAAGSATVNLGGFTRITDGNGAPLTAVAAAVDQIQGTGLVISGAHFTGGTWVTMNNGAVVNVVGAGQTSSGNGTFFGYDPSISAPDEVGGVVIFDGATANVIGIYIAD